MSSPRIIKPRSGRDETPAWAPDAIEATGRGGSDSAYLVSPPGLREAAHERAARVIAEAHAEALTCVEAAKSRAARIHAEAHERGAEEAHRAAQEQHERLAADVRSRLEALVDEITQEREQFFSRVEPEIATLAVSVAEKVVAQEISTQPEIVLNLVRNSMKRMKERESLRVRLNPDDLEMVRAARDDLIGAVDGVRGLDLVEDRRVGRGGCVVESRNGNLDARIKTQLAKMERVITEAAHGDTSDPGSLPLPTADQPHGSG